MTWLSVCRSFSPVFYISARFSLSHKFLVFLPCSSFHTSMFFACIPISPFYSTSLHSIVRVLCNFIFLLFLGPVLMGKPHSFIFLGAIVNVPFYPGSLCLLVSQCHIIFLLSSLLRVLVGG